MNQTFRTAAVVAAALFVTVGHARGQAVVSLAPADAARWDLAGHVAWLTVNKSDIAPDWDDWYNAATFGVTAGYYVTPHLKVEAELSTATPGDLHIEESVGTPFDAYPYPYYPYYQIREHSFRATTAAVGAAYQFFENRWFHPFLTGGLAVTRETHKADYAAAPPYFAGPPPRPTLPPLLPIDESSTRANPFVGVGFKGYVSERQFIRGEVRSTFSTRQVETVAWRIGIGFDF